METYSLELEKAMDIAYQDILKELDLIWDAKGLIMTCSNLVVTWKVRPQMPILSLFSLRLHWFSWGGCILIPSSCESIKHKIVFMGITSLELGLSHDV